MAVKHGVVNVKILEAIGLRAYAYSKYCLCMVRKLREQCLGKDKELGKADKLVDKVANLDQLK